MSTSIRNYLSIAELEEFADITITDEAEGLDRISQCEEIIDAYVGFQDKFIFEPVVGLAAAGGASSLTLQSDQINIFYKDYFLGCLVEIIGGTGIGQRKRCTGSTYAGVLTTETFSTPLSTDSFYKIFQPGKFPRECDVEFYDQNNLTQYFKSIPEAVKRAVAAQVEYAIEMGDSFFASDKPQLQSESIGNYSYSKKSNSEGNEVLIAPKAKILLRGIRNLKGVMIIE